MIVIEPKFNKGDYIINHSSGDIAKIKGISKKGYYQFEAYYSGMSKQLKDLKNLTFELQVNYQKFYELCNDEEREKLEHAIKEKGGN